ncbi:MAG: TIGR04086 family membrane protein [Peptococcaceae bacterium]|nr:TIGR04086 family membrane protein [Peptococcaceae bacterium]
MGKSFEILRVCKGILIALLISFILTILLSAVYYFTSIQESTIHSLITAGISVLFASFYISYQSGSKGLIYGISIGVGYFILSIIIFYIFYEGNPSLIILGEKFLASLVAGGLGGTIGAIVKR